MSGHSSGQNSALVKALLRGRGIRPTQVSPARRFTLQLPASLGAQDITRFSRQLATLFKAGVPLLQGLGMIAEGANNPALRSLLAPSKRYRRRLRPGRCAAQAPAPVRQPVLQPGGRG
ncbi:hypothetical protein NWF32_11415 [Pseudomonas qingdaonensis]|nr:hypothetical protein [Pseudomonas qingdaonensis]